MDDERLKLAVFIDFDNIEIGVKETLRKEFDVSLVLEALKDRGEVVTKVAYGDWSRAGEQSRQMSQHAVQMVQRSVTPRGDKNAADINLALDALEMAFSRPHISAFAIVGGDSDYMPLVEKLRQYGKRVLVVGGRAFTSGILQRNCHEFIAYENLLKSDGGAGRRTPRGAGRAVAELRAVADALPNLERALKILAEREVAPQIGLLKSTMLQLDPTFSERDYGAGSFLEFLQKMQKAGMARLKRTERGFLVETGLVEAEPAAQSLESVAAPAAAPSTEAPAAVAEAVAGDKSAALAKLKAALARFAKGPSRPLYMRHVQKALRTEDKDFNEQSYGFRSLTDLLYFAERQGGVRLQRDRRGVLKVFPTGAAAAESPQAAESVPTVESVTEPPVPPAEGLREVAAVEEAAIQAVEPPPAPVEEVTAVPELERKPRRRRPKRGASAAGRRPRAHPKSKPPEQGSEGPSV